jgi:hypothetical protein
MEEIILFKIFHSNSNKEFYIILKNIMKWEGIIQSKEFKLSKND